MKIALTGATGFIGNYIVRNLIESGHELRCWYREESKRATLAPFADSIQWVPGDLRVDDSAAALIRGCDAIVHNALWRPGSGFQGAEGNVVEFARVNLIGTLDLIDKSFRAGLQRFVFVSTCAVHDQILSDRLLDEAHPLWPRSHYGAHKAAIEKFVHSYGLGSGFPICAIRPSGVYGVRNPVTASKWYELISRIVKEQTLEVQGGGKEVHASDVAKAISILLNADNVAGQSYSCCDRYISQHEVATLAKELSGSSSEIVGTPRVPQHEISSDKLQTLGMQFGSTALLRKTICELVQLARLDQPSSGV